MDRATHKKGDLGAAFACILASLFIVGCYRSTTEEDAATDPFGDPLEEGACGHPICEIVPLCGCEAGFMCTYVEGRGRACVVEGHAMEGQSCRDIECEAGLICDDSVCRRACYEDFDCVGSAECRHEIPGETIRMCNLTCDLVTQEGCPEGYRCDFYESPALDEYFSECLVLLRSGQEGDLCEHYWHLNEGSLDCAPGLVCQYSYDFECGVCRTICSPEDEGMIVSYCPEEYPCCNGTVHAAANGERYPSCTYSYDGCD
jgi:hypothetical protein